MSTSVAASVAAATVADCAVNNTDKEVEAKIPDLPSHLRCHSTVNSGRTITTRIPLSKGSTAFREVPFAHSIHFTARRFTCDSCFAQCDADVSELQCKCSNGCGVYYCSDRCLANGSERHARICHLIRQTNGKTKNAKLMNESLSLLISLSSNVEALEGVMGMLADETKKGRRDTAKAENVFRSLSHDVSLEGRALENEGAYAAALSVRKLNAIGIYNMHGEEVAFCLFPALAMVNHSCVPNCQQIIHNGSCQLRALRDIEADEELSFSYVALNTEATGLDSSDVIEDQWEFTCTCPRCKGGDCSDFDRKHVCYCGSVCYEVDRTLGWCICNGPTV